jgi:hypothetical protein
MQAGVTGRGNPRLSSSGTTGSEGQADDRANDPEVTEKRDAGFEWTRYVNDSGVAPPTWHYLLATETAIRQAGGTWEGLKNFAAWE